MLAYPQLTQTTSLLICEPMVETGKRLERTGGVGSEENRRSGVRTLVSLAQKTRGWKRVTPSSVPAKLITIFTTLRLSEYLTTFLIKTVTDPKPPIS